VLITFRWPQIITIKFHLLSRQQVNIYIIFITFAIISMAMARKNCAI